MDNVKGLRTFIVAIIGAVVTPWLTKHLGITLDQDQQLYAVGMVMGALMGIMRAFTTGAPLQGLRALFARADLTAPQFESIVEAVLSRISFSPEQEKKIALAVIYNLTRRGGDAAQPPKASTQSEIPK
jgi:fructose-specific phosphotransferase system IIC component